MAKGYLALVLHAHLPFVRHPEHEDSLEERWLFEAITETYIPLLKVFEGLAKDGIPFKLTLNVSPTLASMLRDPLLQERYIRHLDKLIELSDREVQRTSWMPDFHRLALDYYHHFSQCRSFFINRCQRDLTAAFAKYAEMGCLEIITTAATHAYFPLFAHQPALVKAQIKLAVDYHTQVFGVPPKGFWLPECGYFPGIDRLLKDEGIEFFFLDAHGIFYGDPIPKYGTYAPVCTPSGISALARDLESSTQVWSSQTGYPGDFVYRDFYKDIGYDLDYDYLEPYMPVKGERTPTGIKYYRITGAGKEKSVYLPEAALEKTKIHARHFIDCRHEQILDMERLMDRPPLVVSPYDAELFGHWWHEGPQWLNQLFRYLHFEYTGIEPVTPSQYLARHGKNQKVDPIMSSWGVNGYSEVWLDPKNDWIYRHIHQAADRMMELVQENIDLPELKERAMKQAARELLLAMSSDWPFIIKTGTMEEYASRRVRDHLANFNRIYTEMQAGIIDESWLSELESRNNLFPDLDLSAFSSLPL